MPSSERDGRQRRAAYLTLMGLFTAAFAAFARRTSPARGDQAVGLIDLTMLGLSVYRLGRLVAYDRVTQPVREPFTETKPDDSGAGDAVEPAGRGARRVLGELLSCPTCVGTWAAAVLVYALQLAPGPIRLLLAIMSATGVAELLDGAAEALTWTGQAARKRAGSGSS